ncbi:MAG: MFS transporter, partial [Candidatus Riflebacteria bacterium]|nr:MFS transporter [Candidatus Riflebacteria bacterium]
MSDKSGTTRELLPWLISGTSLLIKGTNNLLYLGILSVFLRNYGSEFLPWFYIILNISFISFQFGVTPHIIGKEGHPLLFAVSVFTAALTLCAGFLIDSNHLITLILCLAFARLIDLITNQAFSAMTNELFTIRESKKYLSYAYAAGSFGYILSGLMLKFVIEITGINGLLWLNGIGVLFLLALLRGINRIYKEGDTHQSGESAHNKSDNPIPANKTEKKSASVPTFKQPLARDLSLAAFFIVFNTFMTDFLYSGIISGYFSDSDSLASFMGVFGAATDLSVILTQASIMNWVFTA